MIIPYNMASHENRCYPRLQVKTIILLQSICCCIHIDINYTVKLLSTKESHDVARRPLPTRNEWVKVVDRQVSYIQRILYGNLYGKTIVGA